MTDGFAKALRDRASTKAVAARALQGTPDGDVLEIEIVDLLGGADRIDALVEEIDLLRARSPRKYILARASEWVRLFREVHGYLRICHRQHGTDWEGRNHAMNALLEAMEFVGASDAAREVKLEELREAEARARSLQKAERT